MNVKLHPKVVLGVAAHPDDLDYYAGGTMAAFARQGAEVYYLVLTDGGKGSSDRSMSSTTLRDIRREEQRNAGKILGLKDVFFRDYPDGTLENTLAVKQDVVKVIRQVKPDTVIGLDPSILYSSEHGFMNHPDHRAAGQATLDAVYPLARDHMSFPELLADGYEPHEVGTLLLIRYNVAESSFAVNISDTIDLKYKALSEHHSQFSIQQMKHDIESIASKAGASYGFPYAESFERIDIA